MKNFTLDRELSAIVEQFPELYDTGHPDYKIQKDDVWTTISEMLGTKGIVCSLDCFKRWAALRNRYSKERKRRYRIAAKTGNENPISWPLYKTLSSFLEPFVKKRTSIAVWSPQPEFVEVPEARLDAVTGEFYSNTQLLPGSASNTDDRARKRRREKKYEDEEEDVLIESAVKRVVHAIEDSSTERENSSDMQVFPNVLSSIERENSDVKAFTNLMYYEVLKVPAQNRLKLKIEILQVLEKFQQ